MEFTWVLGAVWVEEEAWRRWGGRVEMERGRWERVRTGIGDGLGGIAGVCRLCGVGEVFVYVDEVCFTLTERWSDVMVRD